MLRLIVVVVVAALAWWTGGFGLLGLAHALLSAWVATAPALFEVGLLLVWLWGLVYVPAIRKLTFGLLKLCLVIISFGLLLGLLSRGHRALVAEAWLHQRLGGAAPDDRCPSRHVIG